MVEDSNSEKPTIRVKPRIGIGCTLLLAAACSPAEVGSSVSADVYARAERFLFWNAHRYVINGDIRHHWIGTEDRFWYLRTAASGAEEFVVVDAATGKRAAAFDQHRLAAELSHSPTQSDPAEVVSPDGKWAAVLRDHNIWLRSKSGKTEFALTTDGVEHYSYASSPGVSTHAVIDARFPRPQPPQVLWSPDSRYLLTYRLDERQVQELALVQSAPEDGRARPQLHGYRYPLPGDAHLPMQEPIVLDVAARRQVKLQTEPLICAVFSFVEKRDAWWSQDGLRLYYLRRDRYSRSLSLHVADPRTGTVQEVLRESADRLVDSNADNVFELPLTRTLTNGDVIWYSQRDGWGHLYYYDASGRVRNQITHGDWAVRTIVRVDERTARIYFTASGRESGRDPYQHYLYSIGFDGGDLQLLTPEPADHELRVSSLVAGVRSAEEDKELGAFSPSGRYFVASYSRPDLPPTTVLRAADGRLIAKLEQADISRLTFGGYSRVEPFKVRSADGTTFIYGNLFRPSGFDPARKYPVIDAIYPGPQMIRSGKSFMASAFGFLEAQSLAELGFIVVTIDGRGTPNRSREFLDYSYERMALASDIDDHIAGIRELAQRYPYMDLARVGIDGWSAGGYAAARAMLTHPEFYKVGVSVAGVHDLRGYMAVWGETYNGPLTQGDYVSTANSALADRLAGKLLLVHGDVDDNVPPALTLQFAAALIAHNKDFDLLLVPNGNHQIVASPYVIRRKWDYFVRHLLGAQPPAGYAIAPPVTPGR